MVDDGRASARDAEAARGLLASPAMDHERLYALPFSKLYPAYVQKAEKKGRTKAEVDEVLTWLTGYTPRGLARVLDESVDVRGFFKNAPKLNPKAKAVTGVVCGVRVEEVKEPLMRKLRILDKLVDELAKGRAMEKVLRSAPAAKPAKRAKPRATR